MGYRSDVKSYVMGPVDKMDALLAEFKMRGHTFEDGNMGVPDELKVGLVPPEISGTDKDFKIVSLETEGVKWYDSYPFVKAWTLLISMASEREELFYEFARIGEEMDDNEHDCDGSYDYDWLNIERSIASAIPEPVKEEIDD